MRDFYTIAFSKPLVREIGWSYGVSDEDSFIISGGLLDAYLKPKPAYYALQDLINSWTTTGTGKTDDNGEFEFRGFAGDYEVTLETTSGQSLKTTVHVYEQQTHEITIIFPTAPEIKPRTRSIYNPEIEPSPATTTRPTTTPTQEEMLLLKKLIYQ